MLNPLKNVLTVEMARSLIAKIKGALATKVSMDDVVSSWQSTPDDAHVPTEKLVKDTLDNLPPGTAVKGDAESEYRTGNVNLTPANIGAYSKTESDSLLSAKENAINKKQSVDPTSTTDYLSAKAVADFVNSSVATNTANFLGNFSLTDLGLTYPATDVQIAAALNSHTWPTGVTPTNNDYVYVEIQDPQTTGVDDKVERFKFSSLLASWGYEYTLNNSSFTAAEIAAIDSGITATDKGNYDAHLANTNNPHSVTAAQVGAEPAFSVLPISKGGTGKNNAKGALNAITSEMQHYDTQPQDYTLIVQKFGTSSDGNGALYTRTWLYAWNYIKGKILGWYDWTRVDSGIGCYAKICSIADPASGTSYTVDVLVTHMTSYYAVTGLVRITVSHGSSSVQASILASDSLFYAVDSGNPPKVYTYVDGNGKRTFVFDTASAYQTAQGFVFRAVGGFSDKWSFLGDVGCSNDAADLGSIGTKQDALDVPFVFATYAKTAGHAATATSADSATSATNAGYAYQAGNAATVNSHTVDKDVPSNAVFTDTTYSQISRGSGAGLAPGLPSGSGTSKYLREDGTWYTPPNDTYSAGEGLTLSEFSQFSVDNPFNPNGDYSSNTLKANYAVSAGSATSAGNYSSGGGIDSALQGKAPKLHIDTQGIYGLAKEGYYGHVKLEKGNLSGRTYSDGAAASVNHNHDGNYLKNPQSKTLQWGGASVIGTYNGNDITLTMPANPFDPNGDYSSNTLKANSAVSADSAQYAVGASNYTQNGSIATKFNNLDNFASLGFTQWKLSSPVVAYTPTSTKKKFIDGWDRGDDTNRRRSGVAFLYIQNNTNSTIYFDLKVMLTPASGTAITYTFTLGCLGSCGVPFTYYMDLKHYNYDFSIYKNASLSTGSVTCYIGGLVYTGKFESTDS